MKVKYVLTFVTGNLMKFQCQWQWLPAARPTVQDQEPSCYENPPDFLAALCGGVPAAKIMVSQVHTTAQKCSQIVTGTALLFILLK